jgi:hypothetical protein
MNPVIVRLKYLNVLAFYGEGRLKKKNRLKHGLVMSVA